MERVGSVIRVKAYKLPWLSCGAQVWWDGDQKTYWGRAEPTADPSEVRVWYDDGYNEVEEVGSGKGQAKYLVNRSVASRPCTCVPGVTRANCDIEEELRACAVCYTLDIRANSEPGLRNEMIFCAQCGVPVHLFCYGQMTHGALLGRR